MVGWTTVDSAEAARKLADRLIEEKLAACVQIDGPMQAVFPWKERVECETEFRLWIKTRFALANDLEAFLKHEHPYDTPQWIAVPASAVADDYRQWVGESTRR